MARLMRIRDGQIETAIWGYDHRDGMAVTLVGIVHFGSVAYYQALNETIRVLAMRPAIVQCEGIRRISGEAYNNLDAEDKELLDLLERAVDQTLSDRQAKAYVSQYQALRLEPTWKNADINELTLARMIGRLRLSIMARDQSDAKQLTALQLAKQTRQAANLSRLIRWVDTSYRHALVVERSRIGLEGIDHVLADPAQPNSLVAVWGLGHLPDFHRGLRKRGFKRRSCKWVRPRVTH